MLYHILHPYHVSVTELLYARLIQQKLTYWFLTTHILEYIHALCIQPVQIDAINIICDLYFTFRWQVLLSGISSVAPLAKASDVCLQCGHSMAW